MPDAPQSASRIDNATKLLSLVSLAIGVFAAYKALPVDAEIKELQAQTARHDIAIKQADADLKNLESSRKITLELYQEVKKVIELNEKNAREEEAVRVLVDSLAEDPFRWKLLRVLSVGASSSEVKEKASNSATFYEEDAALKTPVIPSPVPAPEPAPAQQAKKLARPGSGVGGYNVDFFFCEARRATSEPLVMAALKLKGNGDTGRWRARLLPSEINAQPGYQIGSSQIRFTPPDETQVAETLVRLLAEKGIPLERRETGYPTPNYVSVFICQ